MQLLFGFRLVGILFWVPPCRTDKPGQLSFKANTAFVHCLHNLKVRPFIFLRGYRLVEHDILVTLFYRIYKFIIWRSLANWVKRGDKRRRKANAYFWRAGANLVFIHLNAPLKQQSINRVGVHYPLARRPGENRKPAILR